MHIPGTSYDSPAHPVPKNQISIENYPLEKNRTKDSI